MKRSKPTGSVTSNSPQPPRKIASRTQLREWQRVMATALFRPLTPGWGVQKGWVDGRGTDEVASELINPELLPLILSDLGTVGFCATGIITLESNPSSPNRRSCSLRCRLPHRPL
jgi:hypothetical protein